MSQLFARLVHHFATEVRGDGEVLFGVGACVRVVCRCSFRDCVRDGFLWPF